MNLPIENLRVPIEMPQLGKKFFVLMSAYVVNNTDIDVVVEFSQGKHIKQKITLSFPYNEELAKKTNQRTALYQACVKAQNKIQHAVTLLVKTVLESRRTFEARMIGTTDSALTYCGRGFAGLQIKLN